MADILKTSAQAYFPPKNVFFNEFLFTTDITKILGRTAIKEESHDFKTQSSGNTFITSQSGKTLTSPAA